MAKLIDKPKPFFCQHVYLLISYYKLLSKLLEYLGNEDENFMNVSKDRPTTTYIYHSFTLYLCFGCSLFI
jgi:hypothetical protein